MQRQSATGKFVTLGVAALATASVAGQAASAAILVTNNSGNSILKFSDAGVAEGTFTTGVTGGPADIDLHNGAIYITTFNPASVYKYDLNGNQLSQLVTSVPSSRAYKSQFGPDGNLYLGASDTNVVHKYNGTTGALISTFATGAGVAVGDLQFGADGHLYTAGQSNGFVRRYHGTTGALLYAWDTNVGANRTGGVRGFDMSPDGTRLYISDSNFGLRYIDLATNVVTTIVPIASWAGNDVKFGPDGFLYSLIRGGTNDIRKYNPIDGTYLGQVVTGLPGGQWSFDFIAIPEPTSATMLAAVATLVLRRKRMA